MWLFEKRGFVSVVAYDPKKDKVNKVHSKMAKTSADPAGMWLLVRARVEADLEEVEKIIGHDIMISEDKGADYSFRALVSRDDFKAYLCAAVDDIDYGAHFKEVCEKNSSQGKARHSAMMRCWTAMSDLQPNPPYGGWTYTYSSTKGTTYDDTAEWKGDDWKGKDYYDKVFGAEDDKSDDWYDWQPAGKGAKASPPSWVTSAPPKELPDFTPSTYWVEVKDFAKNLLGGMVLADMSHDEVESLTDDAFEMFLEASTRHSQDEVLSAVDVEALCGETVYAEITGEDNNNG